MTARGLAQQSVKPDRCAGRVARHGRNLRAGWKCMAAAFCASTSKDDSYLAEWRHFLKCIDDGGSPLVSGHDGLAVLRVIDAARRSSTTGAVVSVGRNAIGHEGFHAII